MERQQPLATGIYGYLYATRVDQPASGKSVQSQIDISSVQLNVRKALLSVISEIEPHLTTEQTTDLLSATVKLIPKLEENQRRRVANVLSRLTPELTVLQQQQLLMGNEVSPPLTEDQREQLLVHSSEVLFVSKDLERELQHVANRISPALTANQQQQFTRAMTMIFPTLERVKEILKVVDSYNTRICFDFYSPFLLGVVASSSRFVNGGPPRLFTASHNSHNMHYSITLFFSNCNF